MKRRIQRGRRGPWHVFLLAMTLAAVTGMAVFSLAEKGGAALAVGVAGGALLFVRATFGGGRLGNARGAGHGHEDDALRIGTLLALAGMAAGAQSHDSAPVLAMRLFLGMAQALLSAAAVWLAVRQAKRAQAAKLPGGTDDPAAAD